MTTLEREPLPMVLAKSLIAAAAVLLFLLPLATPPGLVAGAAGTVLGYVLARQAGGRGIRLPAGLLLAIGLGALAHFAGRFLLDHPLASTVQAAIGESDATFFGLAAMALFFGLRLLSQRARVFTVLELAVVVGAVAHTFADHRNHHIDQPRFFTDWAWSHGIDPSTILAGAGVAAIVLAAMMLLDVRRAGKLMATLLLLVVGGVASYLLFRDASVGNKDDDPSELAELKGDGSSGSKGGGSGGKGGRPPDPVAVVLLHDDLPDADVLYFRQAVLSRFAVDRLTEDRTGTFDHDVITSFPPGQPLRVDSPQNPAFHHELHTSVYLLKDHAQLFGLGHPIEMGPLDNPNPRQFVAAYNVDSLLLDVDLRRLVGHQAVPDAWTAEERAHYLELPADPRYKALSDRLVRDSDPRFVGDDLMKALAIKRYLEKNGFYSLSQKTLVGADPAGKFLFGEMKGYCVHFAHAAVLLLRSQGIPARVAMGYAVQTSRHGAGSSILIMGNDAHAWPEMYLDGVGWITFDIYPEKSDEPPPSPINQDLESMLGELARKDKTGGRSADPNARLIIPWALISGSFGGLIGGLLLAAYAVKGTRRMLRGNHRVLYRSVLDRFSDIGAERELGETRERHAARLAKLAPSFAALTRAHLRLALGRAAEQQRELPGMITLAAQARAELAARSTFQMRLWGVLNPIGWWFTR